VRRLEASKLVTLIAAALLVGLPVGAGQVAELPFKSGTFEPPRTAPSFQLQSSNGAPFKLSDARGKVVALAFGFTHCVRICPTTLSTLARVKEKLGPAADKLQVVFVTVDPERDSVARLREFVSMFDASFLGLTGPNPELQAIRKAYGVTIDKQPAEDARLGYQVHHSSSILLIDREGKLRLFAPFGKSADDIVHDIKLLLR
jgi:protein SCO1